STLLRHMSKIASSYTTLAATFIIKQALRSRAEKRYIYPASFIHEFPLYSNHAGMPDIAK
ncbi:hypothetical protein, partial [Muribaculum intestinale]|uniref:hypothetical protein n=1 Tax=Muribaculum intestinale TaxID=1796646 RepID=UPI003EBB1E92